MNQYNITMDLDTELTINVYDNNTYSTYSTILNEHTINKKYMQTIGNFYKMVQECVKTGAYTIKFKRDTLLLDVNYDNVIQCEFRIQLEKNDSQCTEPSLVPIKKLEEKINNSNFHTQGMFSTVCIGMNTTSAAGLISYVPIILSIPNIPIIIKLCDASSICNYDYATNVLIMVLNNIVFNRSLRYIQCEELSLFDNLRGINGSNFFGNMPFSVSVIKTNSKTYHIFKANINYFEKSIMTNLHTLELSGTGYANGDHSPLLTTNIKEIIVSQGCDFANYDCIKHKIQVKHV